MARTKQVTLGRKKEPEDLKRHRSSFSRIARKSIRVANTSFETEQNISRKSIMNANSRPYARKSISDATTAEEESSEMRAVRPSYGKTRLSRKRSSTKEGTTLNISSTTHTNDLNASQQSQMSHVGRKSIVNANVFPRGTHAKTFRKSGNHLCPFRASRITHRRKPGILALQQIRYYQQKTGLLIPKLSFQRVVNELLHSYTTAHYRIQREALLALQEATEMHLVQKFENGQLCAVHANRVTLLPRDFALLKYFDD